MASLKVPGLCYGYFFLYWKAFICFYPINYESKNIFSNECEKVFNTARVLTFFSALHCGFKRHFLDPTSAIWSFGCPPPNRDIEPSESCWNIPLPRRFQALEYLKRKGVRTIFFSWIAFQHPKLCEVILNRVSERRFLWILNKTGSCLLRVRPKYAQQLWPHVFTCAHIFYFKTRFFQINH